MQKFLFGLTCMIISLASCVQNANNQIGKKIVEHDHIWNQTFIRLNQSDQCVSQELIQISNLDGTAYAEINLATGAITKYSDSAVVEPFEFFPEYSLLTFISNGEGHITVNKKGDVKIIGLSDCLDVWTWEDYMLNAWVGFDSNLNPVKTKPKEDAEPLLLEDLNYADYYIKIVEVQESWVRIKCENACDFKCPQSSFDGWVKWRDSDTVLLSFFWAC